MTREEFEEWFEERKAEALDDVQQSDTSKQKWLMRLHAALKAVADQEDAEPEEEEEEDPFDDDAEDDDAPADDEEET